jgi:hypothetical protein
MTKPTVFFQEPPEQGPVGKRPESYFKDLPAPAGTYVASIAKVPGVGSKILDRGQVRKVSQDTTIDPLVAYACIMAWGGRNFRNYRLSLGNGNATKVGDLVRYLRASGGSREEDFAYTQKAAEKIPGLGISFYTKLLFFLRKKPDAYILDQWTAKSASVLSSFPKIKLTSLGLPHPKTSPKSYEAFCAAIDNCAGPSGWGSAWKSGEDVERTIFDRPGGKWRTWLNSHFENADGKITPKQQPRGSGANPPKPPKAPPGAPPAPGGNLGGDGPQGEDRQRAFAEFLRQFYLRNLEAGAFLPEKCGHFARPNKLHVMGRNGPIWQFVINDSEVHAEIFFPKDYVGLYDEAVVSVLNPAVNGENRHQFAENITGNGPKLRITRAIDCHPEGAHGSYLAPVGQWPAICQSAVDAMQQLFEFFEPYLP